MYWPAGLARDWPSRATRATQLLSSRPPCWPATALAFFFAGLAHLVVAQGVHHCTRRRHAPLCPFHAIAEVSFASGLHVPLSARILWTNAPPCARAQRVQLLVQLRIAVLACPWGRARGEVVSSGGGVAVPPPPVPGRWPLILSFPGNHVNAYSVAPRTFPHVIDQCAPHRTERACAPSPSRDQL